MYKLPKFKKFSHEVFEENGRMILSYRTKHDRGRVELASGTNDHVHVRRVGDSVYILSHSWRFTYVGLARFELTGKGKWEEDHTVGASVFLQGSEQCEEAFGKEWEDMNDDELIGILEEYL